MIRLFLATLVTAITLLPSAATEYAFRVINVYPHDRTSFTQGLEYRDGFLYESTG
jgi:glutaminyl-peptide cyclotransferase